METSSGKYGGDHRGDVHGLNGSVPNRRSTPSGAGPHSPAGGTGRAAVTKNQIHAAATSSAVAMMGAGSTPEDEEGIATPGAPSPSVLNPEEMRELMAGNATTSSRLRPSNTVQSAAALGTGKGKLRPSRQSKQGDAAKQAARAGTRARGRRQLGGVHEKPGRRHVPKQKKSLGSGCLVLTSWLQSWPWCRKRA